MEFEDIGAHCSFSACCTKDFLPFQCGKCNKIFCLDHRSCKEHKCSMADVDDVMVIICPICSAKIKITGAEDPNLIYAQHNSDGCTHKYVKPAAKKRCDADSCYAVLTPVNTYTCSKCGGLNYCMKHRFPDTHDCYPGKVRYVKSRLLKPAEPKEICPLCQKSLPASELLKHCNEEHDVT